MQSFLTSIPAGVQAVAQGWRWSYWTLGIVNTIVFLLFVFFYEETKYVAVVCGVDSTETTMPVGKIQMINTDTKQAKLNSSIETLTANESTTVNLKKVSTLEYKAQPHIDPNIPMNSYKQRLRWTTTTNEAYFTMFFEPFTVLFRFPHVMFTALQYASGVAWLTILSSVLSISYASPPYNFSPAGIGYMSLGPFVGNTIGSVYGGVLGDWMIKFLARRNKGYFEPEFRLYLLHLPAIFMAGGLIMFGATTDKVIIRIP